MSPGHSDAMMSGRGEASPLDPRSAFAFSSGSGTAPGSLLSSPRTRSSRSFPSVTESWRVSWALCGEFPTRP